jgi:hypothetical protein
MGYYLTGASLGQSDVPAGCAAVPTELSPGNPYTAAVCPEAGCGPNSYRGLAKMFADLGYQTPLNASGNPDLRPAWEQFRRDYNFPPATSPSQEAESTICAELIRVWSGQGGSRLPTGVRKLSSAAARNLVARRLMITMPTSQTSPEAAAATEEAPTTTAAPEPGFWAARSTVEKGLIVVGGLAVAGGAVFLFMRKKP